MAFTFPFFLRLFVILRLLSLGEMLHLFLVVLSYTCHVKDIRYKNFSEILYLDHIQQAVLPRVWIRLHVLLKSLCFWNGLLLLVLDHHFFFLFSISKFWYFLPHFRKRKPLLPLLETSRVVPFFEFQYNHDGVFLFCMGWLCGRPCSFLFLYNIGGRKKRKSKKRRKNSETIKRPCNDSGGVKEFKFFFLHLSFSAANIQHNHFRSSKYFGALIWRPWIWSLSDANAFFFFFFFFLSLKKSYVHVLSSWLKIFVRTFLARCRVWSTGIGPFTLGHVLFFLCFSSLFFHQTYAGGRKKTKCPKKKNTGSVSQTTWPTKDIPNLCWAQSFFCLLVYQTMIELNQSPRKFDFPCTWPLFAGKERARIFNRNVHQHCECIRLAEIAR